MPSGWPADTAFPEFPSGTWTFADGDTWDTTNNGEGRWTPFGPWAGGTTLTWPTDWPLAVTPGAYTVTHNSLQAKLTTNFCTISLEVQIGGATPEDLRWHLLQITETGGVTLRGDPSQSYAAALYAPVVEYESGKYGARLVFYANQQNLDAMTFTTKVVSINDATASDSDAVTPVNGGEFLQFEDLTIKFRENGDRAIIEVSDT
jgi:hypothetical protein